MSIVRLSLTPSIEWSTCSWLLFVELAKKQAELEASQSKQRRSSPLVEEVAKAHDGGTSVSSPHAQENVTDPSRDTEADIRGLDVPNPHLTWAEVRQVMTRPDFVNELDRLNIIHIDRHHRIRADSMPLLRAFRRVAESEGFEDRLAEVMDRVSAIESLGRTREVRSRLVQIKRDHNADNDLSQLLWKEQGDGGRFLVRHDGKGHELEAWTLLGGDERLGRDSKEDEKK